MLSTRAGSVFHALSTRLTHVTSRKIVLLAQRRYYLLPAASKYAVLIIDGRNTSKIQFDIRNLVGFPFCPILDYHRKQPNNRLAPWLSSSALVRVCPFVGAFTDILAASIKTSFTPLPCLALHSRYLEARMRLATARPCTSSTQSNASVSESLEKFVIKTYIFYLLIWHWYLSLPWQSFACPCIFPQVTLQRNKT